MFVETFQSDLLLCGERSAVQEPLIWCPCSIPSPLHLARYYVFANQVQYRLEEVVVDPQLVVERVDSDALLRRIEAAIA